MEIFCGNHKNLSRTQTKICTIRALYMGNYKIGSQGGCFILVSYNMIIVEKLFFKNKEEL